MRPINLSSYFLILFIISLSSFSDDGIISGLSQLEDLKSVKVSEFCEEEKNYLPFERDKPRDFQFEYMSSDEFHDGAWTEGYIMNKQTKEKHHLDLTVENIGVNSIAGKPIHPELEVSREWNFYSKDKSKSDTFLWITDSPGSGKVSDRMDSIIMMFPKKTRPYAKLEGEEIVVVLPTGEKVYYDKNTKVITRGVIKEQKVDTNPDRTQRKFPAIDYQGEGLSIRIDHKGEDPRYFAKLAVIKQKDKICKLPTQDLWSGVEFKFVDDNELKKFINLKCTQKFNF